MSLLAIKTRMYRYPLPEPGASMQVFVTSGSLPRCVGSDERMRPSIWFEVRTDVSTRMEWMVETVRTNSNTPPSMSYVGSLRVGPWVWHAFAKRLQDPEPEPEAVSIEIEVEKITEQE